MIRQVLYREMSKPESSLRRRGVVKFSFDIESWGRFLLSDKPAGEFRMLCRRCPAYRRHDSVLGFPMEIREPVVRMLRETPKWRTHKGLSTDAAHWDGAVRSSAEASVMEVERRGGVRQFSVIPNDM